MITGGERDGVYDTTSFRVKKARGQALRTGMPKAQMPAKFLRYISVSD